MSDTITVYDSTTPLSIPDNAEWMLGYVDGVNTHGNYADMRHRFPHGNILPVTVTGGNLDTAICDCEKGDARPATAAEWAVEKHKRGKIPSDHQPCVYYVASNRDAVISALHRAGALDYTRLYVANYDNNPHIPPMHVGHQYGDPTQTHHHYDISVVDKAWAEFALGIAQSHPITDAHRLLLKGSREFLLNRVQHRWEMTDADKQLVTGVIRAAEQAIAVK